MKNRRARALLAATVIALAIGGAACGTPASGGGGGGFNPTECFHATANLGNDMIFAASGTSTTYASTNGTCSGAVLGTGYTFHWSPVLPLDPDVAAAMRGSVCTPRGFSILFPIGAFLAAQNPAMSSVWLCGNP